MTTTIVLAAGRGRRLGGPKALVAWRLPDGRTVPLAAAHAAVRLAAECERVVVVARQDVVDELASWLPTGAKALTSTAPEAEGPAGSIAAAVTRLGTAEARGVAGEACLEGIALVTPVDCVPAEPRTVGRLIGELRRNSSAWAARPIVGERRGHPVALRLRALGRYGEPDPPPLRDHLRDLGERVIDIAVDDRKVLLNVNSPADLVAAGQAGPVFMTGKGRSR